MANICITGDSIEARWPYSINGSTFSYSLIEAVRWQVNISFNDLAVGSTQLDDALGYWNALSSGAKSSFDYVIISGCRNNLGSGLASYVSEAQTLINQVNTDKQASCKIILTTCCPSVQNNYSTYLLVNEAIRGQGSSPLTGFDYYIDEHSAYMDNGSGALKTEYIGAGNDTLHPNAAGREVYADAIAKKLKSIGIAV